MRKIFLVLGGFLLLCGGCASMYGKPRVVILHNPLTAEFVDCKVSGEVATPESFVQNETCIENLKKQGFIVWGQR